MSSLGVRQGPLSGINPRFMFRSARRYPMSPRRASDKRSRQAPGRPGPGPRSERTPLVTMFGVSVLVASLTVMPTGAAPSMTGRHPTVVRRPGGAGVAGDRRDPCDQGRGEVDRRHQSRHHPLGSQDEGRGLCDRRVHAPGRPSHGGSDRGGPLPHRRRAPARHRGQRSGNQAAAVTSTDSPRSLPTRRSTAPGAAHSSPPAMALAPREARRMCGRDRRPLTADHPAGAD